MAKHSPNYNYLVTWKPTKQTVNREAKFEAKSNNANLSVKKDILKSLILVSLILALEVVVYLVALRLEVIIK